MVQDEVVDAILGDVISMMRHLKASAADLCALFTLTDDEGRVSTLSVTQYRLVIFLYRNGRKSVSEVAADSGVTLATASQMLDKLFTAGWIERGPNPLDRRQVHVWLTERAMAVARQIHALRRAQVRAALTLLESDDADQVLRVFGAFNTALASLPDVVALARENASPPLSTTADSD